MCSSVLDLIAAFLLRRLFLFYPFIKESFLQPQTTQMSCSQDICSSLVLSSNNSSDSLRQHCCLRFLFVTRELPLLGHVSLFGTCLPFVLQEQVCSFTYSCSRSMILWQTIFYRVVSQFLDLQMAVSHFTSDLDPLAM